MAFEKIIPPAKPVKTSGTAMVNITIQKTKGSATKEGKLKPILSLADTMYTNLKDFTNVIVLAGTGDDYGKLRVQRAEAIAHSDVYPTTYEEGAIKVILPKFGGAKLNIHNFDAMPSIAFGKLPCPVISQDVDGFVIELPLLLWKAGRISAQEENSRTIGTNQKGEKTNHQDEAIKPVKRPEGSLVNIYGNVIEGAAYCRPIEYINKKGGKLAKLAEDSWQYRSDPDAESERISTDTLVSIINKIRLNQGLSGISKHQLAVG